MREILNDMVQQIAPLFEKVRVTTDESGIKLSAYLDDKNLLMTASMKDVVPEFTGEFGIGSLPMLKGLLEFASYKTDDAKLTVHRAKRDDVEYVSEFEFRDKHGGRARFKTMSAKMAGDQLTVTNIPWELEFSPDKSKITEVAKLSQLFAEENFGLTVDDDDRLFLTIGTKNDSTHSATIMLVEGIGQSERKLINEGNLLFNLNRFNAILRNAGGSPTVVKFSSRGVIGVVVETTRGAYTFYLRGKQL